MPNNVITFLSFIYHCKIW